LGGLCGVLIGLAQGEMGGQIGGTIGEGLNQLKTLVPTRRMRIFLIF